MTETIYSIWSQIVGLYEPILNSDGTFSVDWGYIMCSLVALLGFYFLLKCMFYLVKVVLKDVQSITGF